MLLATEMLRQLRIYQERSDALAADTKAAAAALAAAVERHGLDQLQVYPTPEPPQLPGNARSLFLGIVMMSAGEPPASQAQAPARHRSVAGSRSLPRRLRKTAVGGSRHCRARRQSQSSHARIPPHRAPRRGAGESAAAGGGGRAQADRRATRHDGARRNHPHPLVAQGNDGQRALISSSQAAPVR